MTSNPWDEFDKSSKEREPDRDDSLSGFFNSSTKKSKKSSKDNVFETYEKSGISETISTINNFLQKTPFNLKIKNNLQIFLIIVFFFLFFWLISGFYIIKQEESAIIMRFGKYIDNASTGLHYHIPYPIENVIKEQTKRVRVLKIGGNNVLSNSRELGEGWAITGDENIVNLELSVQWKIDNLEKFIFGVRDKEKTIYDATQSAIREVVSKRKLVDILTSGRSEIEFETQKLLQNMLNSYNLGVNIIVVQLLNIDPPAQVIDSFRDVQTARVDKESEINKAYKYRNDILPKIKGEAGKIIEDANGYAISVINKAKGEANRFNQIYEQYKDAPLITRKRIYLETMEEIFSKNKILIVDENVKNVFVDEKGILNENQKQSSLSINED